MAVLYTRKHNIPFIVDEDDVDLVVLYCWSTDSNGYIQARIDDKVKRLHLFLFGTLPPGQNWRFINGDRTDNRRENLEIKARQKNGEKRPEETSGVYAIRNLITGVLYIGSSRNMFRRWIWHLWYLEHRIHRNSYLQDAWDLDGRESFQLEILAVASEENLTELEQEFIDKNNCYNMRPAGNRPGFELSIETRQRIGESNFGQIRSGDALLNLQEASRRQRGRVVSEATRERMRNSAIARWKK